MVTGFVLPLVWSTAPGIPTPWGYAARSAVQLANVCAAGRGAVVVAFVIGVFATVVCVGTGGTGAGRGGATAATSTGGEVGIGTTVLATNVGTSDGCIVVGSLESVAGAVVAAVRGAATKGASLADDAVVCVVLALLPVTPLIQASSATPVSPQATSCRGRLRCTAAQQASATGRRRSHQATRTGLRRR